MGLLDVIKGLNDMAREMNEKSREAYEDAMEMDDDELIRKIKDGYGSSAKRAGWIEAAKQRGLVRG